MFSTLFSSQNSAVKHAVLHLHANAALKSMSLPSCLQQINVRLPPVTFLDLVIANDALTYKQPGGLCLVGAADIEARNFVITPNFISPVEMSKE